MSNHISEVKLIEALSLYQEYLLKDIPPSNVLEKEQTFSEKFERNMQRLIQREHYPPRHLGHHLAKRVAVVALILLLTMSSLMSVEAIRTPVIQFFKEVHQTFTRIVFGKADENAIVPGSIEEIHLPAYIPEGYTLDFEVTEPTLIVRAYTNGDDYFEWNQFPLDTPHYVDTEGTTLEEITMGGMTYHYYSNKGRQHLIWEQYEYGFSCQGTLSQESLLPIATGIK